MLSYQHAYHAGNPADVHKHVALALLLAHLARKDKPFAVVDLYAGEGDYDLSQFAPQKTGEYRHGIEPVLAAPRPPPALAPYLAAVRELNPDGEIKHYPGSPAWARAHLRADDRLILNELHPTAYANLGRWARKDERISVHQRDSLEALPALVPPTPRRGLVLIDPPYELKGEYTAVAEKLVEAHGKWREGIYVLWYAILNEGRHRGLLDILTAGIEAPILADEISFTLPKRGDGVSGLLGSGLVVINPPFQFDALMKEAGDWLARAFKDGRHSSRWLKQLG